MKTNTMNRAEFAEKLRAVYKHERLDGRTADNGWWDDYADIVINSHYADYLRDGFNLVSQFESATGEVVRI